MKKNSKELEIKGYRFIINSDGNLGRAEHPKKMTFNEFLIYHSVLGELLDEMQKLMSEKAQNNNG